MQPTMPIDVLLYKVGRNLNRAYRTCASFGVQRLVLVNCDQSFLAGNLFSVTGTVEIEQKDNLDIGDETLVLCPHGDQPLHLFEGWERISRLCIGGETFGVPKSVRSQRVSIPTSFELTVEAALAIALYEWKTKCLR